MNKDNVFHIKTVQENGWQVVYVSLAWDNAKCTQAPFLASHDIDGTKKTAIEAAIGRLWQEHGDEIISHIQEEKLEALRKVSTKDIPVGESREMLILMHNRGRPAPKLYFDDDETEEETQS